MSGMFGGQKQPIVPVTNPADNQARLNDALARKLQAGGSNADLVSSTTAPTGGAHMPTLTGLN